ncbi:MAG: OmpA family protein [Treponema sp.]|nr:OmpA family protein [Treponema sp.]
MAKLKKSFTFTLFLAFLLLVCVNAAAERFEFRHVPGAQYRIISVVDEVVLVNGVFVHRAEILNRIAVEVTNVEDGAGEHKATFQTSERLLYDPIVGMQTGVAGYQWSREYETIFLRDKLGNLTIAPQYYMPVVRNVPTFPDRELQIGDRWNAPAHEVHDFRDAFGIEEPYRIPFNAFYEYLGERQWKEKTYPAFSVNYNVDTRPQPVRGRLYPVRITGTFNQLVYWDRTLGKEAAYEEEFRITFHMSDGRIIEYRGTAYAELIDAEYMDKEQLVAEIIDQINSLGLTDVNVSAVDEGISLSLDDIRFYPDSNRMLPGEQEKLDLIAEILLRYPDRDILVSGHAALAGSRDYLMRLSQDRARAVADYLLSRNVRTADRIVTRGYGAERPVADNSTEEGMRRNRRVEITILEN